MGSWTTNNLEYLNSNLSVFDENEKHAILAILCSWNDLFSIACCLSPMPLFFLNRNVQDHTQTISNPNTREFILISKNAVNIEVCLLLCMYVCSYVCLIVCLFVQFLFV